VRAESVQRAGHVVQGRPAAAAQSATEPRRRRSRSSTDAQERRQRRRRPIQRRRQERPQRSQTLRTVSVSLHVLLTSTRTVLPVATCRQSPYLHKPATVKLLLLIYSFKFRSAFLY